MFSVTQIFFPIFQSYLKNLKKKQKEISKKHSIKDENVEKSCSEEGSGGEEEEDSDLASIARELQVIFKPESGIMIA